MSIEKAFVYGMAVSGNNFTDREKEQRRLRLDFENGINVTIISPRRMGKTSLVKKVIADMDDPSLCIIYMDIYDCRSEYDFLNRFASAILRATERNVEAVIAGVGRFLTRLTPKISFSTGPDNEFSLSLGITPRDYSPEEILQLPETIARKKGIRIVVCIDEFQQIGEFTDSIDVQKRLRGIWQHQQQVSYCLFGSKKHLMEKFFQDKRMPFYMFGEMMQLQCIPTEYWIPYITGRFEKYGKHIAPHFAEAICTAVGNYSSYVQQLAWNVMAETDTEVTESSFSAGETALMEQCNSLFVSQTEGLTTYQLNFLRLLSSGIHSGFSTSETMSLYPLGSKSNIDRIRNALLEKELIAVRPEGVFFADPVMELWFGRNMMS